MLYYSNIISIFYICITYLFLLSLFFIPSNLTFYQYENYKTAASNRATKTEEPPKASPKKEEIKKEEPIEKVEEKKEVKKVEEKKEEVKAEEKPKIPKAEHGFGIAVIKLVNSMDGAGGEVVSLRPRIQIHSSAASTLTNKEIIKYNWKNDELNAEMNDNDEYNWQEMCLKETEDENKLQMFAHEFDTMAENATDPICCVELLNEDNQPVYWSYFHVMENNSAGQGNVKLGELKLDCWAPPVRFPNPPGDAASEPKETKLHVIVYACGHAPDDLFGKKIEKKEETKKEETKKEETKKENTKKEDGPKKDAGGEAFILIDHGPPPATPLFSNGDGFDLYIDGARFLPDNVTIPKVTARIFNHDFGYVALSSEEKQETCVCTLNDNVFCPEWKLRMEYRRNESTTEHKFDPTSTLNIRIETIEELSKKVEVVGYCGLNLFCKPGSKDAPDNPSQLEYVLNKGAHQIPIYYGAPDQKQEWSVHNLEKHPKVPCATLLVRIVPAAKSEDGTKNLSQHDTGVEQSQWEDLGLLTPFKGYKEGDYDSVHATPSIHEENLYNYRKKQENITLRDRAEKAKRNSKVDKWESSTVDDETLIKWCTTRMDQKPQDMLHPQGIVSYHPDAGFKVKIERLYNFKKKSAFKQINKVIYCTNPPGGWYSDPKMTEEVYFTTRHDWKSGAPSQRYLDDWTDIIGKELDHNSTLVLEIKSCVIKNGKKKTDPQILKVENVGWTCIPLFDAGTILSGFYQLPVYAGKPPSGFIADCQTEEAEKILEDCVANPKRKDGKSYQKEIKLLDGNAQVLIKIIDR